MGETKKILIPSNLPGMTLLESSVNNQTIQNSESENQVGGKKVDNISLIPEVDAPTYGPIFDNNNQLEDPTNLALPEIFSIPSLNNEFIPEIPTINKVVKTPKRVKSSRAKTTLVEKDQTIKDINNNNLNKIPKKDNNKDNKGNNKDETIKTATIKTTIKTITIKTATIKTEGNNKDDNKNTKTNKNLSMIKISDKSKILSRTNKRTRRSKFEISKNKPFIKRTKDGFCYFAGPIKDSMELHRNKKTSSKLKYKALSPKSMNLTKKYKRIVLTLPSKNHYVPNLINIDNNKLQYLI